jgi:hypothetical protein
MVFNLSDQLYLIMKSYLSERYFQVKIDDELSAYHLIRARVPQGSILGPLLYLIFTADVPLTGKTQMATFADDTAIMSSDHDPNAASKKLQQYLNLLQRPQRLTHTICNRSHKNICEETQKSDCTKQQPTNKKPVQST